MSSMNPELAQAFLYLSNGNKSDFINQLKKIDARHIEQLNQNGRNLLHHAVKNDASKDYLHAIFKAFPNINVENVDLSGSTPLTTAATIGNATCLKILVSHGANKSFKNDQGITAKDIVKQRHRGASELMNALKSSHLKLKILLATHLSLLALGIYIGVSIKSNQNSCDSNSLPEPPRCSLF